MALLIQAATLGERIGSPLGGLSECYLPFCDGQGGVIGAIIILVGIAALIIAIERLITLTFVVGGKVKAQRSSATPNRDNPLGRVLSVYEENKDVDVETLELKMGEAILENTRSYEAHQLNPSDLGGSSVGRTAGYGNRYDRDLPGDYLVRYR